MIGRRATRQAAAIATIAFLLPAIAAHAQEPAGNASRADDTARDAKRTPPANANEGYTIVGDGIPIPLTSAGGDAVRGRVIVATRQVGLCLLCHTGPVPEERFQGSLAPDLAGAGSRWTAAQLRLRLVDSRKLNPASIMPSYFRTEGFNRVGPAWQGKTILGAQQIEDVIAYLLTLKAANQG